MSSMHKTILQDLVNKFPGLATGDDEVNGCDLVEFLSNCNLYAYTTGPWNMPKTKSEIIKRVKECNKLFFSNQNKDYFKDESYDWDIESSILTIARLDSSQVKYKWENDDFKLLLTR